MNQISTCDAVEGVQISQEEIEALKEAAGDQFGAEMK